MTRRVLAFFVLLLPTISYAQQTFQHLNHKDYTWLGEALQEKAPEIHTGMKPLLRSQYSENIEENVLYRKTKDFLIPAGFQQSWFWRKLRNEDFIDFEKDNFQLLVNPLLQLEAGRDRVAGSSHLINTRGIMLEGRVGKKFGFYTSFYENQATFPEYIDKFASSVGMIPGQGTPKPFQETGHDYSRAEAYICFSPTKWLTAQLGHGRHFIGEGYRSLLLSDNALVYPYLRISLRYKQWQWTMMRSQFSDFGKPTQTEKVWHYEYHYRRYASSNYISYKPHKKIEIGLYEATMWQSTDTISNTDKLETAYYAPVPLLHTAMNGLNGKHNVLLGLNLKIDLPEKLQFYTQFMVDDVNFKQSVRDKYGFQAGLKYWDVARLNNLYLQTEFNYVRPFAYAHNDPRANWTHSNQPLAHPLGANFSEVLVIGRYQWRDIQLYGKVSYATTGTDPENEHWGSNIYVSDTDASTTESIAMQQGGSANLIHIGGKIAFVINPRTNLQLYVQFNRRQYKTEASTHETDYLGFGVRTSLYNAYYDF